MLLILMTACAPPVFGTWMFTREVTLPTGEECGDTVSHNFDGASTPEEAAADTGWVESDAGEISAEVLFGRLERTEGDGAVLILGDLALPGGEQDDGSWLFWWTTSSSGQETDTHASGYAYVKDHTSDSVLRVAGTFDGGAFTGTHETESLVTQTWTESDSWSEEAAAYVGENGEMPVGDYLQVVDQAGTLTAANNSRELLECADESCTLSVQETCAYRYTLTGTATELSPDDAAWAEDAGQAAGG